MARQIRSFLLLFGLLILLTGCCGRVQCDCIGNAVTLVYRSGNGDPCPAVFRETLTLKAYNKADGAFVRNLDFGGGYGCEVYIEYVESYYWIIASDSLGISDTLRIANPEFSEPSGGCCNCPSRLLGGDISINQDNYATVNFERIY